MKLNFTAVYSIDGNKQTMPMEYDTKDAAATLERRLKTAFPNATSVTITLDTPTKAR